MIDGRSQIVITVPRAVKGAWVSASRSHGQKLTDWIIERVGMSQDYAGFTLNVPALVPFEEYVIALTDADAHTLFKRVRELDAKDEFMAVSVKVAKSYLEKRVAIADGIADHALMHDINVWALDHYSRYTELTHLDLIEVVFTAAVAQSGGE